MKEERNFIEVEAKNKYFGNWKSLKMLK